MKKNESFSRKSAHFLKCACFALFLASYGGSAVYAEASYAEQATLTVKMNNSTVKEVFSHIEKNSEFIFVYHGSKIDLNRKVNVNVNNQSVEKILDSMFSGTDVEYIIKDRQIIVRKNEKQETKAITPAPQQEKKTIKGIVKDNLGEPLIGVNIMVKGSTKGTTTEVDGSYTLNDVTPNTTLSITYIGYKPQEIPVGNKSQLNITLQEDSEVLDEVVVLGYGVQKKVNLSGSVATVSSKALENRPILSVGQALQGAVANMNVSIGSGQATDSPKFNIRGVTSLNESSPLVVIDGVVSDKDQLNRMNPSDIENISVLKDASSSAIYGSRAAFGVILVTTKTGKNEKLTINYNNNFVMRQLTSMPDIITDPYDIATTRNTMSYPWYNNYNEEQLAYAKKRSEDPNNTSPYFLNPDGKYSYFGNTDWVNEAYKNIGFSTSHNVDISGKTDKLNYYFSANYNFQDGMVKYGTDKYNRYNLRSKLDFKISKWWSISNNTSYVTSDYESPEYLGSSYYWEINRINPMDVPKNPDGSWTEDGASVLGRLSEGGRWKKIETTLNTQFGTQIDIIKNVLFVKGTFAYTSTKNKENGHTLPINYYQGPELPPVIIDEVSSAYGKNTDSEHILFDVYGTFQKTFKEKHALTAIVGFNQEEYRWDKMSLSRKGLISTTLPSPGLATGDMSVDQEVSTWALRGAFARLNYTFDNKYIVEFNGRYDGTSRFPKNKRYAFNPSGSVAWVMSREKFWEPLQDVVSFLKVRASYGSLGNQDVSAYAYLATMGSGKTSQILDGKQPVYVSAPGLVSGNLTWEKVTTSNIGLDVNFLNNRLTVSGDAYIRRTNDMLTPGASLPNVLGTQVPNENAADLETKGWEITLGWQDQTKLAGKPLNYGVNFNLSDSRAFITRFANDTKTLKDHYVGKEMGEIWGATTLGFFTSEEDIKNHADQSLVTSYPGTRPLAPGDLKFEDTDKSGAIDWGKWTTDDHGDYHIIGNNRARFTFGFTANGDWNGFDMNLFIQGVGKQDYMPGVSDLYFWGIYAQPWTNVTYGNFHDRWTEENPNGYFPRFKSYVAENGDQECGVPQTRYLQNAAYARLKNLTFGYTLPRPITQKAGIERLRVFFSGDNLCEISGLYKHYKVDPEGLGGSSYPLQRSYSFGLNVTF